MGCILTLRSDFLPSSCLAWALICGNLTSCRFPARQSFVFVLLMDGLTVPIVRTETPKLDLRASAQPQADCDIRSKCRNGHCFRSKRCSLILSLLGTGYVYYDREPRACPKIVDEAFVMILGHSYYY